MMKERISPPEAGAATQSLAATGRLHHAWTGGLEDGDGDTGALGSLGEAGHVGGELESQRRHSDC